MSNLISTLFNVETPNLDPQKRGQLLTTLSSVFSSGIRPTVSIRYRKVTQTKRRIQGSSFVKINGIPCDLHIGEITKVEMTKTGNITLLVRDVLRSNGCQSFGWTKMRLEGIQDFTLMGIRQPSQRPSVNVPSEPVEPVVSETITDTTGRPEFDFSMDSLG